MLWTFEGFTLDLEQGNLIGPEGERRLRPQAFRLLEVLVSNAPQVLSHELLLERVWGPEHFSQSSVKQAVSEIRQALGDSPERPRFVATVHRHGYRFIAPVEQAVGPPQESAAAAPAPSPPADPAPSPAAAGHSGSRALSWKVAALLAAGALVVAALLWWLLHLGRPPLQSATAARPAVRPSLAVLGFLNRSGDPEIAWIGEFLEQTVALELSADGAFRVVPWQRVAAARRALQLPVAVSYPPDELRRIGTQLGADLVVLGHYSRAAPDERVHLSLTVRTAATDTAVATFNRVAASAELSSLGFGLGHILRDRLHPPQPPSGPVAQATPPSISSQPEVLRLYSLGVERLRAFDRTAALDLLEQALALDPDAPLVLDAAAVAYQQLGFSQTALEAAQRALDHAADLPREQRLLAEARVHQLSSRWPDAIADYEALWTSFPDNVDYGLELAAMQTKGGRAAAAAATLAALRALPTPVGDDPRIDLQAAKTAYEIGAFEQARQAASRAVEVARARQQRGVEASALRDLAWVLLKLGRIDDALADADAAIAILTEMGDRGGTARAVVLKASLLQQTGQLDGAELLLRETIDEFRQLGDRLAEAQALHNLATVLAAQGRVAACRPLLERSLDIKRELRARTAVAADLSALAGIERALGDRDQARAHLDEALAIYRDSAARDGQAQVLRGLGNLARDRADWAGAGRLYDDALALFRELGDRREEANTLGVLGHLEAAQGRHEAACGYHAAAAEGFRELGARQDLAYALTNLGEAQLALGRTAAATATLTEAVAVGEEVGDQRVRDAAMSLLESANAGSSSHG